jgi:general secretion pathway protein M
MLAPLEARFRASAAGRWFFGREPNERRIIAGIAAVVVVLLVWALMLKPLLDWRSVQENRYHNSLALLDWMHMNEQRARAATQGGGRGAPGSSARIPVITRTAQSNDLNVSRLLPEGAAVTVVLQDQPFNAMLAWIDQLQRNNGVQVVRVTVNGQDTPGYVTAQVKLQ